MKTTRLIPYMILSCLIFAFNTHSHASHAVGSDLTYTCLGGNNYEVTLAFYRDCSGANAPNAPIVKISSQSCGYTGNTEIQLVLTLEPGYPIDVTPVCGAIQTNCVAGAGGYMGIEKMVYKGLLVLPVACTDWIFSYRMCCRNPAITNIVNPGNQAMYNEATLDNLNAPCNSSSSFSNDPVPYACINKPFCFNQGALDPDGDLLTYTLINPKTTSNSTISYLPNYSANAPVSLPPGGAFALDPVTGDICFTSNAIEVTVIAVLVEEWRGGIKIGSTIRDIQLNTIICNNDNPEPGDIFGNNSASNVFSETVCAGSPVLFTIQGFDPDAGDNLTMSWNGGIPGGNWNVVNQGANNPTATFTWNPGANDISLVPHIFTVSIEDDACPIKGTFTRAYSVTVNGLIVDAGIDEAAGCGQFFARNALAIGGVAPYTYLWSEGTIGAAINNMVCGKYSVTVTDAMGCEGIDEVSIVCPDIQIIAAVIDHETCYNDCDGEIQLQVNGGTAPYTYSWSNSPSINDFAIGLCAGPEWVTVTDQNGCKDSLKSIINTGDIIPNLFLVTEDSLCEAINSVVLQANYPGGIWSGIGVNNIVNPSEFDPAVSGHGKHTVTYDLTTPNGLCHKQMNVDINVLGIDVTTSFIQPLCNGGNDGSVTLTDNYGNISDFHFSDGINATVQSASLFGGLSAGNYFFTGADIGSKFCPANIPVVITEPSPVGNVLAEADITCNGLCNGNIIAAPIGGTAPYSYLWSGGEIFSNLTNLCVGQYSVTISDANGCDFVDLGNIVEPSPFNIQDNIVKANCDKFDGSASVNVAGATPNYMYLWSTGAITSNVNGLNAGTYDVTITDANNCTAVHNVIIGANPGPSLNFNTSITTCFGSCDGSATAIGIGGTTPGIYNYEWSDGQLTDIANGLCAGNYTVTVSDGNNCKFTSNIVVNEPSEVRATINHYPDTTICIGGTATFTAAASGGSGVGYTFTWGNGWIGAGAHDDQPIVPACYSVIAYDDNNCPSPPIATCVDFYDPLVVIALDDEIICEGALVNLSAIALGGNPNSIVTYSWDGGQGVGGHYSTEPQGAFPVAIQIEVIASDGCSPDAVDQVTIDFHPSPIPNFSPENVEICPGEEIEFQNLSVPGDYVACHWNYGDGNFSSECKLASKYVYNEPGAYSVSLSIFSQFGCVGTREGLITVHPDPIADFNTTSPGNLQNMLIGFNDESTGIISDWNWTLFDNNDKSFVLTSKVTSAFEYDYALTADENVYLMKDTGYYPVKLEVTTVNGCSNDTVKYIRIDGMDFINIPNAFSPNGDAKNDFFYPVAIGIEPYDDYVFQIFNRWGDLIFRADDLYEVWDGKTNEMIEVAEAQQAVYIWTLQYRTLEGQLMNDLGHVTLLR